MKTRICVFIAAAFFYFQITVTFSQPVIEWQKCYGGSNMDQALSIQQTNDSGYIVTGFAQSNDGDVIGNHGSWDIFLLKLFSNGNIQWKKCLGGSHTDEGCSIRQTRDGGYIIAGQAGSNDGDVTGNHNAPGVYYYDTWIIKLDDSGNIQWQKCYGGSDNESPGAILQTNDGGYIVSGAASSMDGDVIGNHGASDAWIFKIDSLGNMQWQKCLGGGSQDYLSSLLQTNDGGYVLSGYTYSNNGDVAGNHDPNGWTSDYWVVKIDSSGNIQWQKCLGGSVENDYAASIQHTSDGSYIIAGWAMSNDGDVSGNHGGCDAWIVKLSSAGILLWQKCLGGSGKDIANSIHQTNDGGYIVGGYTTSNNGDVSGNLGGEDYWICKLDSARNIQWQKCLGGSNDERGFFRTTNDGGYIAAGYSKSNDGDVSGNLGDRDFWVVKLSAAAGIDEAITTNDFTIFPNPTTDKIKIIISKKTEIEILNIEGQVLKRIYIEDNETTINIKNLSNGIYIIKAVTDKSITIKKFIKQ